MRILEIFGTQNLALHKQQLGSRLRWGRLQMSSINLDLSKKMNHPICI